MKTGFLGTVMASSCYVNAQGLDQNQDRSYPDQQVKAI